MKVIGAGFGRTGTMSLKVALETLGLDPCYHMTEVFAHTEHTGFWISAWRRSGRLGRGSRCHRVASGQARMHFLRELWSGIPTPRDLSVRDPTLYERVRNTISSERCRPSPPPLRIG